MTHKQNLKKTKNKKQNKTKQNKKKEEKYIPVIIWMVGLIKTFTMDFTNIKLPK